MEKEFDHQGKNVRGVRDDQTPSVEVKRDGAEQSLPENSLPRPRRRIRAYQRIDYWQ